MFFNDQIDAERPFTLLKSWNECERKFSPFFKMKDFVDEILRRHAEREHSRLRFSEDAVFGLLRKFTSLTVEEPAVLTLSGKFCVVGDMHGDLDSLLRIFRKVGYPPQSSYVFLGDYVDRGNFSCEVVLFLYALKVMFPSHIYLLRGNHEFAQMSTMYGFQQECQAKLSQRIFQAICETFDTLPIVAVIGGNLCIHGGITEGIKSRDDLYSISKPQQGVPEFKGFEREMDMLWSDPEFDADGFEESPRGLGHVFGYEEAVQFLRDCDMTRLIRAHQACLNGYNWVFDENGPVLTVFSTCDYTDMMNDAAVVIVSSETDEYEIIAFRPLTRKQMNRADWPDWLLATSPLFRPPEAQLEGPQLISVF